MKKIILIPLFFLLSMQVVFSQSNKVTGKVTNSVDGNPIPGVNVIVQGSLKGSSTDFEGSYVINATSGSTLVFSFLGYETQKVKVDGSSLNVKLKESTGTLDQVVVIGSTIKTSRKEIGNAITSVKSEELMRSQPNSLSSALQGKVAGAQISQNSGDPSGGFSIKLRGTSSILGSSDPLYVIDGVVVSNATTNVSNLNVSSGNSNIRIGQNRSVDINPNDIESVEVLNGGAAAAIYGARASNGVVLLTTKKGKSGNTKYTFSTNTSINILRKKVYTNLVNEQFLTFIPRAPNTNPALPLVVDDRLFPIQNSEPTSTTVNVRGRNLETLKRNVSRYDYQNDIFNTGVGNDTYFAFDGGDAKTKYAMSIGYVSNEGIVRSTDFKRLGTKLRLQHDFNSIISASFGLNYINSFSNEKPDGNVFWSPLNSVTITNNIYNLNDKDASGNLKAVETGRINPLSIIQTFDITQETDRVISDLQINLKPFKNFNADFILGLDKFNQRGNVYIPRYPYAGVNPGFFNDGYVSEAINKVSQFNNDLNIRFVWNINENIRSTTSGGYNVQLYRDQFFSSEGRDLKPLVFNVNAFNTPLAGSPSSGETKYNIWGYYLQETIGFNNKLFLTGAIRQDASTIFSKENRKQFYPKVSASYVLSEEKFMKESIFSSARFRGSWGESGNLTAIGAYSRFTSYNASSLGTNAAFFLESGRRGNSNIKPEKSVTYEIGADIGIIKDRVNLSFSY